jgi:hypothetical protein
MGIARAWKFLSLLTVVHYQWVIFSSILLS